MSTHVAVDVTAHKIFFSLLLNIRLSETMLNLEFIAVVPCDEIWSSKG